ncbi:MAG: hypothetical protein MUO82_08800 [Candidatus Thermoplasmatota archaeon]|nr:hypothetical protein [Candidatus Thermoplasmatota archaeon]
MVNILIDGLMERISSAIALNKSIGILLPSQNYQELIQALFERIKSKPDEAWIYVSVTKPFLNISNQLPFITEIKNIRFIDCISRTAGISNSTKNIIFIESPTMLEKIGLEIMNIFKEVDPKTKKYLVIDSLTNLIIYNDPEIVTEFFHNIINRTRARDINIISLAIEEEGMECYLNRLVNLNDKILKIRDSFI